MSRAPAGSKRKRDAGESLTLTFKKDNCEGFPLQVTTVSEVVSMFGEDCVNHEVEYTEPVQEFFKAEVSMEPNSSLDFGRDGFVVVDLAQTRPDLCALIDDIETKTRALGRDGWTTKDSNGKINMAFNGITSEYKLSEELGPSEYVAGGRCMRRTRDMTRNAEEKAIKKLVDKLSVAVYKIAAEMFKFKVKSSVDSVPTMLLTFPFASWQWPHGDVRAYEEKANGTPDLDRPINYAPDQLLALVTTSTPDSLNILRGSHTHADQAPTQSREFYRLELGKYHLLFAHPLTVHGGAKGVVVAGKDSKLRV